MGKDIGRSYKYNRSKLSTSTLKKYVLSFSAANTSSAGNSTRTSISSQLDNKDITKNQSKNNISNTHYIHSCVTQRKKFSVQDTYTTNNLTPLNTSLPISPVELHKTKKLLLAGKEYLCFQINKKNILMLLSVSNHGY